MKDSGRKAYLAGGEWLTDGIDFPVVHPYDGRVVATISRPGPEGVQTAIESARESARIMARMSSWERGRILAETAAQLKKRKDELGRLICLESGKPLKGALTEAARAVVTFETAARESFNINGETFPLDIAESAGDRIGITARFPLGVIAGISPFNFPLNLVAHKIAPAIAAGNSIVFKPASATPLSALVLGEILVDAGMPPEALNIVPCSARDAEPLVSDDRIDMITFTGSAEVGWGIKAGAGRKKVTLELGGNAALVVEPETDLDKMIPRTLIGAFSYSGQICISIQRIMVHTDIYDEFLQKFKTAAEGLVIGDPLDIGVNIGPMIKESAAIKTESLVNEAVKEGATIVTGGKRDGAVYYPTILTDVRPGLAVDSEEIFAPVVVVHKYEKFEDALDMVNDSRYGLQAGVYTKDLGKAVQAFNRLKVGGVIINDFPTFRVDSMPYGGVKDSGFGREGVKYTIEEMTELRLMVIENKR